MSVTIHALTGPQIHAALDDLARLRIAVFAEWPYLYDGDPAYERDYIAAFAAAPHAILVAAREDGRIVGMASASPLAAQEPALRIPLERAGLDISTLFYFGESVLLPAWRGQGIGHAFFDHREEQARRIGAKAATFAAVIRLPDHPDRPRDYRPLDPFWRKRGYAPVPGLTCALEWKDHRDDGETAKRLQYWMRQL